MGKNSNLLDCSGGGLVLTKDWARNILNRMRMVKQRANTKAKVSVENYDEIKKLFLLDITNNVLMDEIIPEMIINCDHTSINYVCECPLGQWRKLG